jgi:hypothetical protein
MFIPPSCTEIGDYAFRDCKKLVILSIPDTDNTQLGSMVYDETELGNQYDYGIFEEYVEGWLDFLNGGFEDIDE